MELLKYFKIAPGGSQSQLGQEKSLLRILEHFKIIEAKYFTRIEANQKTLNYGAFSTFGASNKIVG